jgi:hypothetical protein
MIGAEQQVRAIGKVRQVHRRRGGRQRRLGVRLEHVADLDRIAGEVDPGQRVDVVDRVNRHPTGDPQVAVTFAFAREVLIRAVQALH